MVHHQARRHPVATFIVVLIFGPFIGAAFLLYAVGYILAALFVAAFGRRR